MDLAQISEYYLKLTYSNLRLYIPGCTQGNTKPKHCQGTNTDTGQAASIKTVSSSLGGAKNYHHQRYCVPYKISIISFFMAPIESC